MTRVLSLLAFAGLVAALFALPSVDPGRLGAFQVGHELLGQSEWRDPALDWRDQLAPGDVVDSLEVLEVADGSVLLAPEVAGGEPRTVALADLAEDAAHSPRPLWRALTGSIQPGAGEGGQNLLLLTASRFTTGPLSGVDELDPRWHGDIKDSVIRALRSTEDADTGDLEILLRTGPEYQGRGVQLVAHLDGPIQRPEGEALLDWSQRGGLSLEITNNETGRTSRAVVEDYQPGDLLVLLPPLVAIFLAILLRKPVIALLAGVLAGSFLLRWLGGDAALTVVGDGTLDVVTVFLREQLVARARIEIVLFVVFMLAMVGVITRAGGIRGLMNRIAGLASDARRTQLATWFMGLAIFFDDYANTILVGSTMRPLADRFRVAREKLAYIVDSTAAPVAGISIFSTWIAFEVSTFSAQLPDAGLSTGQGYEIFLQSLPYRFYCILTLFFVGLLAFTGRDMGPMLRAERRARAGKVLREGAQPLVSKAATELEASSRVTPRATAALLPLATFIGGTIYLILLNGGAFSGGIDLLSIEGMTAVLYEGSGGEPLMYGALAGLIVAILMALVRGLPPGEALRAAWNSLKSMGVALVILYLAWMVGAACAKLGTADYLAVLLGDAVNPLVLPVALFLLSALVAFSTGSSWSTMTILLPLVVGLSFSLGRGLAPDPEVADAYGRLLLVISIGAVLEGAIFGDHCSPISDTTVMSSIASASDHIDHVRTQMPYALTTMGVAVVFGYLPAVFFGDPQRSWLPWACLVAGMVALVVIVRAYGKRADDPAPDPA